MRKWHDKRVHCRELQDELAKQSRILIATENIVKNTKPLLKSQMIANVK